MCLNCYYLLFDVAKVNSFIYICKGFVNKIVVFNII
nr:MAG TPA: hypothetical protein [Caudoviricetes sp.]